jgi:hypothetical protein
LPFLGESGLSGPKLVGLETALDNKLNSYVPSKLERYQMNLSVTTQQKIRGEATLELVLVTVFELRKLFINLSLAAV